MLQIQRKINKVNTNSMKQIYVLFIVFATLILPAKSWAVGKPANGQQQSVSGVVTSATTGEALIGVNVLVKGTGTGTITDFDGKFSVQVSSADAVLVFSFIGYKQIEVPVLGKATLKVEMQDNVEAINEVVVTAFGIKREKKALGYSVQDVSGENINKVRQNNMLNALAGKVAGVLISPSGTGEGGSSRIVIRGNNSISGNNQPLIVVDGIPIDNNSRGGGSASGGIDYGSGISDINPDDIESVSVLKGANAAALYGSRAANGVIMITTKSGTSRKGIGITYSLNGQYSSPLVLPEFQNSYGRITKFANGEEYEAIDFTSSWGGSNLDGRDVRIWTGELAPYSAQPNQITDFFRTGSNFTHSLSIDGGNEQSRFRFSVSHNALKPMLPNSNIDKTNISLNINSKVHEKVTVTAKISYVMQDAFNRPNLTDNPDNPMYGFLRMPRNIRLADMEDYQDVDGYPILWDGKGKAGQISKNQNPFWSINLNTNNDSRKRLIGVASITYEPLYWLKMMVRGGTDYIVDTKENRVAQYTAFEGGGTRSKYSTSMSNGYENNFDFLISANKDFNKLQTSASVGGNYMYTTDYSLSHYGTDLTLPDIYTIMNAKTQSPGQGFSEKAIASLYGMAQVGYNNMIFLDLTARNDWSSTLPASSRSYFYPSASVSAILTDIFSIKSKVLTFAKLRASWAQVGADTGPYQLDFEYSIGPALHNTQYGYKPFTRPNINLKPEITTSMETGLDVRLFTNRIGFDFTLYQTGTINQIIRMPVSRSTGYSLITTNAGLIENKGIEIQFNTVPFKNDNVEWNSNFNFARNQSMIVELDKNVPVYGLTAASTIKVQARTGRPYGDIVGTMYKRSPDGKIIVGEDGLPLMAMREDGSTDFVIGNYNPDFTAGWFNEIIYKGIELSVHLEMQQGGEIFSLSNVIMTREGNSPRTLPGRDEWEASEAAREAAGVRPDKWFPTGGYLPDAVVEIFDTEGNVTGYMDAFRPVAPEDYWRSMSADDRIIAEEFLYDASFIKLKELKLGYRIPKKFLSKMPINSLSMAFTGNNLLFLHKNTVGFDPQSSYTSGNGQGIEYSSLPSARYIGFDLTIGF